MKVIQVNKISKNYNDNIIIDNVTYSFTSNKMYAIFGNSGTGKTTFLYLLAKYIDLNKGDIYILNKNLNEYNDDELANLRKNEIGFIFQNYNLFPFLTVKENIMLSDENIDIKYFNELLDKLELYDKINYKVQDLSGGEQQRVAIIRALVKKPKIIIADEPTSNLDVLNTKRIFELFNKISKKGTCVIIVTHDNTVKKYSDINLLLINGGICEI